MIAAILLSIAGLLIFLLWLLFALAIYALPFYAGLSAAFYAYHHDAGVLGAGVIGLVIGVFTLMIGQFLFAVLRSPWARALVAVYALPAGVADWYAVRGLFRAAGAGEPWLTIFAWAGAIVIAGIAWVRVTSLQPEIEAARARGAYLGRSWYSGTIDRRVSLRQPPQERIENQNRRSF